MRGRRTVNRFAVFARISAVLTSSEISEDAGQAPSRLSFGGLTAGTMCCATVFGRRGRAGANTLISCLGSVQGNASAQPLISGRLVGFYFSCSERKKKGRFVAARRQAAASRRARHPG